MSDDDRTPPEAAQDASGADKPTVSLEKRPGVSLEKRPTVSLAKTPTVSLAKNPGGRPPKYPNEGKRPTLTFRCRPSLQEKLQAAASEADRSVSEEVERRLDKSFEDADLIAAVGAAVRQETNAGIERLVGGKENFDLLVQLSHGIAIANHTTGKSWTEDSATRQMVYDNIVKSLPFILNNPAPRLMSPSEQADAWEKKKEDIRRRQVEGERREAEEARRREEEEAQAEAERRGPRP